MSIDTILAALNYLLVYLFGSVLAVAFCGCKNTRKNWAQLGTVLILILAAQGVLYRWLGMAHTEELYPLVVHLPLALVLCAVSKKGFCWSMISVMTAYLCCQPRRWLASIALLLPGGQRMYYIAGILFTLPLLLFFLYFVAPGVRSIGARALRVQIEFGSLPVLYYFYYYLTAVYTNWLYSGILAAVDFMPAMCCILYLLFIVRFTALERRQQTLEATRRTLNFQVEQSMRELENLRRSQRETAALRHDMRHHLQYVSACITKKDLPGAQAYLRSVCTEIEAQKIVPYCENEPINLILSAFAARAEAAQVKISFRAVLPAQLAIPANDLCVLLSNALENAIYAAGKGPAPREVRLEAYEKEERLYFQIENTYGTAPVLVEGMPVSQEEGHGQGTKSICMLLDRHQGIYSYTIEGKWFILRFTV